LNHFKIFGIALDERDMFLFEFIGNYRTLKEAVEAVDEKEERTVRVWINIEAWTGYGAVAVAMLHAYLSSSLKRP
jgi:hypothetical protein